MPSNSKPFVSLTAVACPPKLLLSGSLPIRAPLTLDDSESDVSSNANVSDTGFDSEGFVSGDDFATASPRPLAADPKPDYASDVEEGSFEAYECNPLVDLSPLHHTSLRVAAFAQLSTYDDDEESEVEVNDEVLSVVRVPSVHVSENFVGAPRIKSLDVKDENFETLMFMNSLPVSQSLFANEFTFFNDMGSEDNFIEAKNGIRSIGIAKELVVDEYGLDKVLGDTEAYDEYSIATETDVMSQYSQDTLSNEQFGRVRVVVMNETEKEGIKPYGIDRNKGITINKLIETDSRMQMNLEVDTRETTNMVEGTSIVVGDISLLKSDNVEDCNNSRMPKQNTRVNDLENRNSLLHSDFRMAGGSVSDASAENIECSTPQRTAANGCQGFAVDPNNECEKLVSTTQSTINSDTKLHDFSASFESFDDCCEGNKIQSVESSKFLYSTILQETTYLENNMSETSLGVSQEDDLLCNDHSHENVKTGLNLVDTLKNEATVDLNTVSQESERDGSASDGDAEGLMTVDLEQFMEQISALSIPLGSKGSGNNCQEEQTVRSSHENVNVTKDDAKRKLIYVASGGESDGSRVTITSADGESSVVFLNDPASFHSLLHFEAQIGFKHSISEKEKEKIEKIWDISVKFLRLVQRVNLSTEDSLVSKVLCRLVADIGRHSNQEFVINFARLSAKKLEEDCQDDLDFSLNILVLGKSGVGKSATINSIFGDMKVMTNAFDPGTTSIKEVSGTIDGVKIRILDTPGLRSHMKEQAFNRTILSSIKRYTKKFPLDVILYVDRVDTQTRDLSDLPILRSITSSLSPSIWQRAILTLTHAASTPLDGPSGSPLSYEVFVAQKSYLVRRSISQAVGDLCQLNPSFMCPVSLVENHPLCGKNISGECVLSNGFRWRSQLLALCFSLKILSEVSSTPGAGPQTLFDHWKHFFFQDHYQPMDHLFSSILQSPAHLKFSANWN